MLHRLNAHAAPALQLAAALAVRLWMLTSLSQANGDTLLYGDLTKNLLLQGRYALTAPNGIRIGR